MVVIVISGDICQTNYNGPSHSVSCEIFNMASFHEIFGDSDPNESFEGFRDSDINDSAVTSTVEEDDDEDDISVKSLSSDEDESEESMDESSSDESNDDVAAPHTRGNDRQSVKENVVTWSEKKTNVKVCTISFERPVNYLCNAWHVFPPKYKVWTHFNRH